MAVFHLLRHGEHGLLGRVLAGRMPGVGLTERGRAEIAAVAERLAGEQIAGLYASPLQRTRESAEILAARLGLPIEFRDDPRWVAWSTQRSLARIPGGESMRQVQRRVVEALLEIAERHHERSVAVVSHGDVIRAALVFTLGMPLDFYNRIEVAQGSVSTIRIDPGGMRVLAVNERPRLPAGPGQPTLSRA